MKYSLIAASLAGLALATDNGDPNCPCTGDISLIPDGQLNKEIGYGTDCRPWDVDMSYCLEQFNGGDKLNPDRYNDGKGWCALEWCYVDRENCGDVSLDNGDTVEGNVQQSVIYPTVELYFSYNTCGNLDLFENSGTVWVWDFGGCPNRTANDYFLLVDGSKSVVDQWAEVQQTMVTVMTEGLNVDGDRVGMVEFSGKRSFGVKDTELIFSFDDSRAASLDAINDMSNLGGQTWTLMGIQRVLEQWEQSSEIDSEDRNKVLALITDGRPKPRTTASPAPGDTAEPGCITTMVDTSLDTCENGADPAPGPGGCRNLHCSDVNMDTTDCCPGDQNPCTSDELPALLQALKDNDVIMAVIAVGKDAANMKSEPYDCVPTDCTIGEANCVCQYDIYYFDCLIKPDYDQSADPVPHRITTITSFENFFEYKDPTASTEGGTDGQICIDPKVLLPPAPPTLACTPIPEPKNVVLILDSSKSMYTRKNRSASAKANWLSVMRDMQNVVCLYNRNSDPAVHRCAFTARDKVGLVRFATKHEVVYDFNRDEGRWWSHVKFTQFVNGVEESAMDRKSLKYMTDTVAALWEGLDMMSVMNPETVILQNGEERAKRREVILITDGRPHCKRDPDTLCRPCAPAWRDETLHYLSVADASLKIVWRGDRQTHDGSIPVDKDQLAADDWFGCLGIDFDDDDQFVLVENFHEDLFRVALIGDEVCVQDQA